VVLQILHSHQLQLTTSHHMFSFELAIISKNSRPSKSSGTNSNALVPTATATWHIS
jgi:hypothetical protein